MLKNNFMSTSKNKTTNVELHKKMEKERRENIDEILSNISKFPKNIVVGGPGTGKSFLFERIIATKKKEGKVKFLAITFTNKLADMLADDLAGLTETKTLHGYAKKFVLDYLNKKGTGWEYYPAISTIIEEDLELKKITKIKIGTNDYTERTKYYKAIGNDDVIHYAVKIALDETGAKNISENYDYILIDEYQDFNNKEAEFIDILANNCEIIIAGDDDQALYGFKDAYAEGLRKKFNKKESKYKKGKLKHSRRCTEVIVNSFNNMADYYDLTKIDNKRIDKEFVCYYPDKIDDNKLNPNIILIQEKSWGVLHVLITTELKKLLKTQKLKSVLIIGEAQKYKRSLSMVAKRLKEMGFKNVSSPYNGDGSFEFDDRTVLAYKLLIKNKESSLAWRLLIGELDEKKEQKIILDSFSKEYPIFDSIPEKFKENHLNKASIFERIINNPKSKRKIIGKASVEELRKQIVIKKKEEREIFFDQLISENKFLSRPLENLDINVCTTLKSKGLGADVVFLVGFDQGVFPENQIPNKGEIYQMLVALTRAKKRLYLINTRKPISKFIESISKKNIE